MNPATLRTAGALLLPAHLLAGAARRAPAPGLPAGGARTLSPDPFR